MRSSCANACGCVATKIIEFTCWLQKMKETNSGTGVSKKRPLRSRIGAIMLSPTDNSFFLLAGRGMYIVYLFGFGSSR